MAMTPEQMIEFFADRAMSLQSHLPTAIRNGDFFWAADIHAGALKSQMMVGLIQWRYRFCDPTPAFRKAIEGTCEVGARLRSLDSSKPVWRHFQFETVEFLKLIVGDDIDRSIMEEMRDAGAGRGDANTAERMLDVFIVLALNGGDLDTPWDEAMDCVSRDKRANLVIETYRNYETIIRAGVASEQANVVLDVENAALTFEKRKKDSYFGGGPQTEGGGPDNDHVVDYRLGAIMKVLLPEDVMTALTPEASRHRWVW